MASHGGTQMGRQILSIGAAFFLTVAVCCTRLNDIPGAQAAPMIRIEKPLHTFPTVFEGNELTHSFTVVNEGSEDLHIRRVTYS
jgi:hypothetical protein